MPLGPVAVDGRGAENTAASVFLVPPEALSDPSFAVGDSTCSSMPWLIAADERFVQIGLETWQP